MKKTNLGRKDLSLTSDIWSLRICGNQSEDVYESLGGDQRNYAEWKKPTQKVTDCMIPLILPIDTHNNVGGMQENYDE